MAERKKMDWQLTIKPAEEEGRIAITGYLNLPNRGTVNFTLTCNMEEFAALADSVKGTVKDFFAQIAKKEIEKTDTSGQL